MADSLEVNSSYVMMENPRLAQAAGSGRLNLTHSPEIRPHIDLLGSAARLESILHYYITPTLILVGNISNLLALVVLGRRSLRRHSHCFLLAVYALTNLLFLNFVIGAQWICKIKGWPHLSELTNWSCGLWAFMHNVLAHSGVWVVVAVATDRCVGSFSPRRAASLCTVFTARAVTALILIFLVVISVHALWIYELQMNGCFARYQHNAYYTLLWSKVSSSLYSYIPLALLLPLNILLVVAAIRRCGVGRCLDNNRRQPRSSPSPPNFLLATLMVSSLHFLLVVPDTVTFLVDRHLPTSKLSLGVVTRIEMTKAITMLMFLVNYVLPGIVLPATSPAFRSECWDLGWDLAEKCCRPRRRLLEMHMVNGNSIMVASSTTGSSGIEDRTASRGQYQQVCESEIIQVSEL